MSRMSKIDFYLVIYDGECPTCEGKKYRVQEHFEGNLYHAVRYTTHIPCLTCQSTGTIRKEVPIREALKEIGIFLGEN